MERTQSDMSNDRPLAGRCSCRMANKKPPPAVPQKHLYLVLDDWDKGYSIYRVGEDDFLVVSDAADDNDKNYDILQDERRHRQAASPLVRIKAPHIAWLVAGHRTKIFAMNPAEYSPGIPVFDTATLSMTVCPITYTRGDLGETPVYASVGGDRLLSFAYPFIDVLGPEPAALSGESSAWSWATIEQYLPFKSDDVCAHAVHPDGRTVFMSVWGYNPGVGPTSVDRVHRGRCSTYAFDVESMEWTYIGEWMLPFRGQGYYDRELDAWVGICCSNKEQGGAGSVCCCDVPRDAAEPRDDVPTWKLCADVLFRRDGLHSGATLAYMGDSKFCLVESRWRVQMEEEEDPRPTREFREVKMTSFVLKYDKLGDLRTTRRRGYASMWYQSHQDRYRANAPVAFWM